MRCSCYNYGIEIDGCTLYSACALACLQSAFIVQYSVQGVFSWYICGPSLSSSMIPMKINSHMINSIRIRFQTCRAIFNMNMNMHRTFPLTQNGHSRGCLKHWLRRVSSVARSYIQSRQFVHASNISNRNGRVSTRCERAKEVRTEKQKRV